MIAATDVPLGVQSGVFAIVLAVAFWLLKRSDDREAKAASVARKDLDTVHAELAMIRKELHDCHTERWHQAERIAALESRLGAPRPPGARTRRDDQS